MALGPCLSSCCDLPCNLCENNLVPEYLLLAMSNWTDFDCPSANAACPSAPNPISPTSSLNTTLQLDPVPELSTAGETGCIVWYEGTMSYGDFLHGDTDNPLQLDDCNVMTGGQITLAVRVTSTGSGTAVYEIFTGLGDGNYTSIGSGTIDDTGEWFCSGGESTEQDGAGLIGIAAYVSDGGVPNVDYALVAGILVGCFSALPTGMAYTIEASDETIRLTA